jgi:hypothetical protein
MTEQFTQEDLCHACETGNLEHVKTIVESNLVDVNERCQIERSPGPIPLVQVLVGITSNRDKTRDNDFYEIIAFLISSGADVNKMYGSNDVKYTMFETKAYRYLENDARHKVLIDFLNDVRSGNEQILRFCKTLRDKYIYLDFETMYEIVQTLKNEYPVKPRGGKRKTRRQKRRQHRHTKSKR